MSEYLDDKNWVLSELMTKWASACSDVEAARNSSLADVPVSRAGFPGDALANLMTVKREIDQFISAPGMADARGMDGPFVVGIINLTG